MKRPLVAVVFAYAAGLLLAPLCQPPPLALLATTLAVLAGALALGKCRPFLLWPLFALTGWTNYTIHTAVLSPDDLRSWLGNQAAVATVRGQLAETPRLKIAERDGEESWRSVARVRVREICRAGSFVPATGEIITTTPSRLGTNYFAGQNVEISGVLAPPEPPLAEGLFDYRHYLATRGIFYELKTESTNDWQLRAPLVATPPLTGRFLNWSQHTLALGLPNEDEPLRLLWAMTLGWRTAFTGDIGDPFLRAGTMHMFAIDGLRIALLSGIIVTLLPVRRRSRAGCGALAMPLIWYYTAATGWESSAVRASVMLTIVLGGWALKRPGDLLNSLAAAALVILLWEPRQIFEASFQLSFFVMLVIALMLPPLNAFTDRWLRHDPLLPEELLSGWRRTSLWLGRKLARYTALSFAAWIGSLPLSAKYFHLFSPVSTPANLLAVPLGTLALMANLGALLCGHWLPWATELFNQAAWFFMVAMTWVSEAATKIPGAYFYVPEPSWLSIAIFYAAVILVCSGWLNSARKKFSAATLFMFLAAMYFWQWEKSRSETDLTVLPLNGGHAVYVDAAGRANDWLINCGNENAVHYTLKNYLRAQGVNALPHLVLADGNLRNSGGAVALDELFDVRELWTSRAKFRSPAYRDAVARFEKPPARHNILNRGETTGCWQVLFPPTATNFAKADDRPLVLRGDFCGTKILLLADLSRASQSELLTTTSANDLRADIVVAGLPTEGEPLCDALIDAVKPHVIVIADSEFPATRRASRAVHERLTPKNIPVIYTRIAGAVKIVTDKHGWKLQTMDGLQLGY